MNMTHKQQLNPGNDCNQNHNASLAQGIERAQTVTAQCVVTPAKPLHGSANRHEFWLDTCREANQMHLGSAVVQELYRKHGCRFAAPTADQVRGVLDALDGAAPHWEQNHPELFYQTLELSFPELLIRR